MDWYFAFHPEAFQAHRKEVSDEQRELILKTYTDFKESEISKIFPNQYFGYTKVTIEQPLKENGEL